MSHVGGATAGALLDGFVAAGWKIERKGNQATLVVDPFRKLTKKEQKSLEPEAGGLIRFLRAEAERHGIRIDAAA